MKNKAKSCIAALLACVMVGSGAAGVMAAETNDSTDTKNPSITTGTVIVTVDWEDAAGADCSLWAWDADGNNFTGGEWPGAVMKYDSEKGTYSYTLESVLADTVSLIASYELEGERIQTNNMENISTSTGYINVTVITGDDGKPVGTAEAVAAPSEDTSKEDESKEDESKEDESKEDESKEDESKEDETKAPVVIDVVAVDDTVIAAIKDDVKAVVTDGVTNVKNPVIAISAIIKPEVITAISNGVKALVNETTGIINIKDDSVKTSFKALGEVVALALDLTDNGTKITKVEGGNLEVTIPIKNILSADAAKAVEYVAVYRAETDGNLTYLGVSAVAADGNIKFQTDHFSDYVFVALEAAEEETTTAPSGDVGTGDFSTSMMFFLIAGVALVGCTAVLSFKKKNA